jgi:hypothetical protein
LGDFHDFHLRLEEKEGFHPSLAHSSRTTDRRLSRIAHFTISFRGAMSAFGTNRSR